LPLEISDSYEMPAEPDAEMDILSSDPDLELA